LFHTNLHVILIGRILYLSLFFLKFLFAYLLYSQFSFINQSLAHLRFMQLFYRLSICYLLFKKLHPLFALLISFLFRTALGLNNLVEARLLDILLEPL